MYVDACFSFATHESLNTHTVSQAHVLLFIYFPRPQFFVVFFFAVVVKLATAGLSGRSHRQEVLGPLKRGRTGPGSLDVDGVDRPFGREPRITASPIVDEAQTVRLASTSRLRAAT